MCIRDSFWAVAALVAVCAYASLPGARAPTRNARGKPAPTPAAVQPSRLVLWVVLALVLCRAVVRAPFVRIALAHLSAFSVLAVLCHTRLVETRPGPVHLTRY